MKGQISTMMYKRTIGMIVFDYLKLSQRRKIEDDVGFLEKRLRS